MAHMEAETMPRILQRSDLQPGLFAGAEEVDVSGGGKRKRKTGLRAAQVRALRALTQRALTNVGLSARAEIDPAWVSDAVYGRVQDATSDTLTSPTKMGLEAEEKAGYRSLLGLGLVTGRAIDVDGKAEWLWELTEAGRKEAAKL